MTQQPAPSLTVLLTCGLEDGGRKAAIAFGVALSALVEGTPTRVFLPLESVVIATPRGVAGIHPRGFSDPLSNYVEHFLDLGGELEVCASCYEEYCRHLPALEEGKSPLREGTQIKGLSSIATRVLYERVLTF
jgi:sulfur relay (sulfurtransferase) complex TusBCD TusD component (DsrE family)